MTLKEKIETITQKYINLYPQEYEAVKEMNINTRKNLIGKFGEIKKTDTTQRLLMEWPATLHGMLSSELTEEERRELFQDPKHKMIRWFAARYPEFAISKI